MLEFFKFLSSDAGAFIGFIIVLYIICNTLVKIFEIVFKRNKDKESE